MCHNLSLKELWQRCQSIGNVREFDTKRRRQKSREFVVLWHDISNGSIHSLGTPAHEAQVSWIQLNRICMESICIYDCGCVGYLMIHYKMMMLRLHDACKTLGIRQFVHAWFPRLGDVWMSPHPCQRSALRGPRSRWDPELQAALRGQIPCWLVSHQKSSWGKWNCWKILKILKI